MTTTHPPSAELAAFVRAARAVGPRALSACRGWTAHDVAAHVAAAAAEVVRHLEPVVAGREAPPTRSFEDREPPWRALDLGGLLDRLAAQVGRVDGLVAQLCARDPDAEVWWTGRRTAVSRFPMHLRSECALHRWDLVGDDVTSASLLSDPKPTSHALDVLGAILPRAGAAHDPGTSFRVVLHSRVGSDLAAADLRRLQGPLAGY